MAWNPALPQRPPQWYSAAGPSRPRQPPQPTSYQAPNYQPAPTAYNLTGGYQPALAFPWAGYDPSYAQAFAASSYGYGQAIFAQQPHDPTPAAGGYAINPAFSQAYAAQTQPPTKRARLDEPPLVDTGGAKVSPGGSWRNCSVAGCRFVGSAADVGIHESDRHLIFPNGRPVERSEEEERYARQKGPAPFIQGTGITLQTDEDIAKWIAERKARWPSAKRIAEKEQERQAAIARGEDPRGRGRGRGRGAAMARRAHDPAARAEDWGRTTPDEQDLQEYRGLGSGRGGRGRGRGDAYGGTRDSRCRGRGRGRGRGGQVDRGYEVRGPAPALTTITTTLALPPKDSVIDTKPAGPPRAATNALTALGSYDSADDSDAGDTTDSDSDSSSSDGSNDTDSTSAHDSEHPPGVGADAEAADDPIASVAPTSAPRKPICKYFAKNGRCKFGDGCKFSHEKVTIVAEAAAPASEKKPQPKQPPAKRANPFQRPSMLGALLANPIQNTLSQLTQTIRFLVANDMLDGVELRPGQADDEERERRKIEVVEGE